MIPQRCLNCGKKVEWLVLGINLCLFLLKGWFALISHSKSLLVDSFESLANFVITIVVIVSLRMASNDADKKFPYGYGKVEFLASGVVNMLLMIAAIGYIVFSFSEMVMVGPEKPPGLIAIVAAVVSIVVNYIAFGYGRCVGEKLGSSAILANAQISLADIGTSVAVIVAVVGCNMGFAQLDHIAAVAICILIIKVTFDGIKSAVKGLMDVSLHDEQRHIRNIIKDMEDTNDRLHIGDIRVRLAGRNLLIDIDLLVPPDWVLSKALKKVDQIKKRIHKRMKDISSVSVQVIDLPVTESIVRSINNRSGSLENN